MGMLNRAGRPALLAAALIIAAGPSRAENLDFSSVAVNAVAGDWQLSLANSKNECSVKLNDKPSQDRLLIGIPAPCKKSIKAVLPVMSWALTDSGQILFMGAKGDTLFAFERKGEGTYLCKTADGGELVLKPVGGRNDAAQRVKSVDTAIANTVSPQPQPNIPAIEAGQYQVLRAGDKDTGCVLVLDIRQGSKPDLGRAFLQNSCDDKGLKLFDPVGWHVEGKDRLFLTARKGHSFGFNKEKYGWNKDPIKGSPLKLVRQ